MLTGEAYQKLRWRCVRRGWLELDLLLSRFLENGYAELDEAEAQAFAELADLDDPDLWDLLNGRKACSGDAHRRVLDKLRSC